MVAYYRGILANAGYKDPDDFTIDGGVINFYGVDKLDGGCKKGGVKCSGATDSPKTNPFGEVDPRAANLKAGLKATDSKAGDIKVVQMQRPGRGMDGSLTLVAFGILWNADQTFETATSTITVHFSATDSAYVAMAKVRDALLRAGWEAVLTADAQLLITRNGRGAQVASLYHEISYFPSGSFTENDDHWVFWTGSLSDVDADGDGVIDR